MESKTSPISIRYEHFQRFCGLLMNSPQTSSSLIVLEDQFDSYLNIWLFCLWLSSQGHGRIKHHEILQLEKSASLWHHSVTQPLKALQQSLAQTLPQDHGLMDLITEEINNARDIERHSILQNFPRIRTRSVNPQRKLDDACKNWLALCRHRQRCPKYVKNAIYDLFSNVFAELDMDMLRDHCDKQLIEAYPYGHQFSITLA